MPKGPSYRLGEEGRISSASSLGLQASEGAGLRLCAFSAWTGKEDIEKGVEKFLLGHGSWSRLSWDQVGCGFRGCRALQGNCVPERSHAVMDVRRSGAKSAHAGS